MIDDVVPRLRDLTTSMNECGFTGISTVVNLAADEIEQLRNDRAEAEPLLDELWNRRTEATEMRDEIKRLRAERDEVRQSYCSLMEAYRGGDGWVTANKLGWGYLFPRRPKKEDGK